MAPVEAYIHTVFPTVKYVITICTGFAILAGIIGNTYALIADGVESLLDIFGSLVVWFGLRVAAEPPDDEHPYGHGKAEAVASTVVALTVIAAAFGLAFQSIREIRTPHQMPAQWTLFVLLGVVIVKECTLSAYAPPQPAL